MYTKPQKKKIKWGRIVVVLIILVVLLKFFALGKNTFTPPQTVVIAKGNTFQKFIESLSSSERNRVKMYIRSHDVDTSKIEVGTYTFSGTYTPETFIQQIMKGPTEEYLRFTVLEGWSIFDIDKSLSEKFNIEQGSFLSYVKDSSVMQELSQKYPFLSEGKLVESLEGYLYPDTYFLGVSGDPIKQLVDASLKRFNEKVYSLWETGKASVTSRLQVRGITLSLNGAVTLASIIEKEERVDAEKPTIAGVFINRLEQGIKLGADITLCYGREQPYETCTPSLIGQYVNDGSNIYNTRVHAGLPPTPISSITDSTFDALLKFKDTDYLFYLHDNQGKIHYGKTNDEHNQNKAQYLQ